MVNPLFERFCAASGVFYAVFLFSALVVAGFFPPLSAALTEQEVIKHYAENYQGIRVGGFMLIFCSMLYIAFSTAIASYMRRVGNGSSSLIYAQLSSAVLAAVTFLLAGLCFIVAAFRPDGLPELTLRLNDFGWITFLIAWPPFMLQYVAFSMAIFSEERAEPLIPRWVGYLNIWVAIGFTPATLLPFFKTGPFAWHGLLVFWLAAALFFIWLFVVTSKLWSALNKD